MLAALGPFVQEDVAVVGAASAAAAGHSGTIGLLLSTWIGLTVSDGWKYWAGRLAHKIPAAARMVESPRVRAAKEQVLKRLATTIIVARFVPGTRIPLNVACGLFHVPFAKYLALIMFSGAVYIGITYALFSILGDIVGEQVRSFLPFIIIPIVLVMVGYFVWRNRRQGLREAEAAKSTPETTPESTPETSPESSP